MDATEQKQVVNAINLEKSELCISDIYNIINNEKNFSHYEKKYKNRLYSLIILSLTHKSFDELEAKNLFEAILKHKKLLEKSLQRDVGISVATIDYLQNIKKLFHNPTIIEENTSDFLTDATTKDGLTNLYVRDVLHIFLKKEIDNAKRQNSYVSFMMIDIDDFKEVNDTYGHQKGDEVLEKIGEVLNQNTRQMDFAARYGGEELCIVLPNTKSDKAYEIATRIRKEIASLSFDGFSVTVSIGISQTDKYKKDEVRLIEIADKALYEAKENGKNQVVIL